MFSHLACFFGYLLDSTAGLTKVVYDLLSLEDLQSIVVNEAK